MKFETWQVKLAEELREVDTSRGQERAVLTKMVSIATTLLLARQYSMSRRRPTPVLLPPVVLAAQVADTVAGLAVGRAEVMI